MIFNSLPFLFAFLPLCIAAYYLLARFVPGLRRYFLLAATVLFYSFGGLEYTLLLLLSVTLNFAVAKFLMLRRGSKAATYALAGTVIINLLLLGLFKYSAPAIDLWNFASGGQADYLRLVLPIGISFFTFQQIGFLVDLNRGRFDVVSWRDYAGFILFFPTLLAGPITRFDEVRDQIAADPEKGAALRNLAIGLAIFSIGLFKKSMLADTLGLYSAPVFDAAADGSAPGFIDSWLATFAYTAQIYFDFAGYSDMAIGVARMFGIVLPANFHSPLRSTSITEIWRRWHITLGRWVMTYVFQPLSVPMARLSINRDLGKWGTFGVGFAIPTAAAMITIALWHGAGATFLFFGVCHSVFMIINEWWKMLRKARNKGKKRKDQAASPFWKAASIALTVICFSVTCVAFRAYDVGVMMDFYGAMLGMNGLEGTVLAAQEWPLGASGAVLMLLLAWAIIFFPPNTQQIMARFKPVLEWDRWSKIDPPLIRFEWRMTAGWAVAIGIVFFLGFIFMMRGTTEFIYFNF